MIEITRELVIGTGSAKRLVVSPDGVSNGHWLVRRDAIGGATNWTTAGGLHRALRLDLEVDFPIEAVTESTRRTKRARQMKSWLHDPAEGRTFHRTNVEVDSNDGTGPVIVMFADHAPTAAGTTKNFPAVGISQFYADHFSFTDLIALDHRVKGPLRTPDGAVVIMPVALRYYPQEAVDLAIARRPA